jgi:type IV secretion system protein VirB8
MNEMRKEELEDYYAEAESWSADRQRASDNSRRIAWICAGIAALIALVEAFALLSLIPLKREVPYTLLVDRQTGYVEALKPLDRSTLTPDAALTRSFLVQYVIARESFDPDTVQETYRKVGLLSADEARERYLAEMQATNPASPLAALPPGSTIDAQIRSVSSLNADTSLVRFTTVQTDRGGQGQQAQHWAAVIKYRYTQAEMSTEDRLTNPLGFQVVRYRKDPETLPIVSEVGPLPSADAATPAARGRQ